LVHALGKLRLKWEKVRWGKIVGKGVDPSKSGEKPCRTGKKKNK